MRKNDGWLNALFALIFIAAPAIVAFYFLLPDWTNKIIVSYGVMWGISIGFIAYVALLSFILIYTRVLAIDSLNFNVPLTIVFVSLLVSYGIPLYARALIVLALILSAFPVNMLVNNFKRAQVKKNRR